MKDFILRLSREALENFVKTKDILPIPKNYPKELDKKQGVFVTIFKKDELRGCIGFPYPDKTLVKGIIEASCLVSQDPRFEPLKEDELEKIKIEISILTEPELIETTPENYGQAIVIGKHGLIIKSGMFSGLFLPQVPIEQGWDLDEYLENLCYKASLPVMSWKDSSSKLYRFETEVFKEGI